MKGRIARLEGITRKQNTANDSLKKYIYMLEKALKERDRQLKALKTGNHVAEASPEPAKEGREGVGKLQIRRRLSVPFSFAFG